MVRTSISLVAAMIDSRMLAGGPHTFCAVPYGLAGLVQLVQLVELVELGELGDGGTAVRLTA